MRARTRDEPNGIERFRVATVRAPSKRHILRMETKAERVATCDHTPFSDATTPVTPLFLPPTTTQGKRERRKRGAHKAHEHQAGVHTVAKREGNTEKGTRGRRAPAHTRTHTQTDEKGLCARNDAHASAYREEEREKAG